MPFIQFHLVKKQELYGKRTAASLSLEKLSKQLFTVIFSLILISSFAKAEDVILRHSFAGNISFELTGNTLRNANNTCRQINGGSSSGTITLPINSTIQAAYLYWSGSGNIDSNVTLNGQTVNADISYTEAFDGRNYFSSKAEVTSLVSNNSSTNYQVSGVTFDGSRNYCNSGGAYAGWSLAIIYEQDNEPLRVINVFDGFKSFWGSSFNLSPDNFVIASSPSSLGGKHAHITWEGDDGNSQGLNGQVESLKFENVDLTDSNNPSNNQFNGYSNVTGTTSGVDIDEYDIGNLLVAGATSVNTSYSSGQDAVFLTAELISVPNEPVANLSVQQTGPSAFNRGGEGAISINVSNMGPNTAPPNTRISLPLPTGLSLKSFSGSNWNCIESASNVTCTYLNSISDSNSATELNLTFDIAANTANSITLASTVIGIEFDNVISNNTSTKNYAIVSPNFSTSIKQVTDINGGNVQGGDLLRYQIDIIESNGVSANAISLVDHLPANISSFNVVSIPTGATDESLQAPAGNNGSGQVSVSNINISANGTVSVIIDAMINASVPMDSAIDNTATITYLGINDISVQAPTVYVSRPTNPATGNKPLYIRQSNTISRIQPTSSSFISLADTSEQNWTITPEFKKQFRFSGSTVNAYLFLQNSYTSGSWGHSVTLTLLHNNISIGSANRSITVPSAGVSGDNVALFEFSIPLTSLPNIQAGDSLSITINNNSDYAEDNLRVYSIDPNTNNTDSVSPFSLISLPAATVINIDNIEITDDANSTSINSATANTNISIDAVVSDPFGSFDITSALITITDTNGTVHVSNNNMLVASDSGNAEKTYTFSYSIPADAVLGDWRIAVTAKEGVEDEIDHTSELILNISAPLPNIQITKSVEVFSDPIHGASSTNNYSKALPGALLTYTLTAINTGSGTAQNNSIWINDSTPQNTAMSVADFTGIAGTGPIYVEPVSSPSGLTYNFISLSSSSDDIEFSNNNGTDFNYSPVADASGTDKNITHFRINPKGSFLAPSGAETATQFTLKFRVQLQ